MSLTDYPVFIPYGRVLTCPPLTPECTVECEEDKIAIIIQNSIASEHRLQTGDWIRVKALARIEEKEEKEHLAYYHRPLNSGWKCYRTLKEVEIEKIGPLKTMEAIKNARNALKRHHEDWEFNSSFETIKKTINILEIAIQELSQIMHESYRKEKEMNAPVKHLSVDNI